VGPSRRDDGTVGTTGKCQRFEGGAVYYSAKTGAVAVSTRVADYLDSHGGVSCRRGFPVSLEREAESQYGTKGYMQRFEGGRNYPKEIRDQWPAGDKPGGATVYTSDAYGTYTVGYGNGKLHEKSRRDQELARFPHIR